MNIIPLSIRDVKIIEPDRFEDERGFFSPLYEEQQFYRLGISDKFTRLNSSFSRKKGTIRGLHYQLAPKQEAKMIRVVQGRIWDITLDLRENSPTFGLWQGIELCAQTRNWLYIPAGCAHGFQTVEDSSEVLYLCSSDYDVRAERGIRWDDAAFQISWPLQPTVLSPKDRSWPNFHSSHQKASE